MKKEFVPYEQALALKELGFDEPCFGFFREYCDKQLLMMHSQLPKYEEKYLVKYIENGTLLPAPTFSQAFRWFREKYNLWSMIYPRDGWNYAIQRIDETISCTEESYHKTDITTYEEAELACLKKLIELVKERNNEKKHNG